MKTHRRESERFFGEHRVSDAQERSRPAFPAWPYIPLPPSSTPKLFPLETPADICNSTCTPYSPASTRTSTMLVEYETTLCYD